MSTALAAPLPSQLRVEPQAQPAVNAPDPAVIARHQEELRVQGYTIFRDLISPEHLATMRRLIDAYIARTTVAGSGQHYHGVNLVAWDAAFAEVAADPLLLATFEGLIGSDCILSSCNLGARIPGCVAQGLHRDTGIWGASLPFMPFTVGIQTAWCIDDFTLENGATRLIPGSHADPAPVGDREGVQVVAPAGSVIAFDCQAYHAGSANRTQDIRRGVLTLYIRSWLKPQTDHKRSYPTDKISTASQQLLRLLGFRRQSPVEFPDGRSEVIMAPGATAFYDQAPAATTTY
jgi:hypothetical protein